MVEFNLCWDSYRKNICNGFTHLQQMEELVDMTLAADGCLVKVHKTLLAIASPYFKTLIQSAPCPHPVLILQNVSYEMLTLLLEFLYSGEVQVPYEKICTFIETAKALHITGLENFSPSMITKNPGLKNPSQTTKLLGVTIQKQVNQRKASETIKEKVQQNSKTSENLDFVYTYSNDKNEENTQNQELSTQTFIADSQTAPIDNHGTVNHPAETAHSFYSEFVAHVNNKCDDDNVSQAMENTSYTSTKRFQSLNSETEMFNLISLDIKKGNPDLGQEIDNSMNNVETLAYNYSDAQRPSEFSLYKSHNTENSTSNEGTEVLEAMETTNREPDKKYFIDIQFPSTSKEPPVISIDQGCQRNPVVLETEKSHVDVHKNPPLFFLNSKNGLQMIFNRFLYNAHHKGRLKRRWRCIDYRHRRCQAYVDTIGDTIVARNFIHKHSFHDEKILTRGGSKNVFTSLEKLISN